MPDVSSGSLIKGAKSPSEALNIVCDVVDKLEERIGYLEDRVISLEKSDGSGWDHWDNDNPEHDPTVGTAWSPPEGVPEKIEELKGLLVGNEDAKECEALRAQIILLEDQLVPPPDMGDDLEQHRTDVTSGDGSSTVSLPTVTLEEEDVREEFARTVLKIPEYYGDLGEEFVQSYRKGGPLLFYYSDRDFIMSLPDDIKRTLVNDVEASSPNEAHEMARDILKDLEANGPDTTVENQIRMQAAGT